MSKPDRYLLDVNVLVALLDENHEHYQAANAWFETPGLQWAVCPFTEAGFMRYMVRSKVVQTSMQEATAILARLSQRSGHHFQPISAEWQTLSERFSKRLFGHNQITDAYLLGLAVHEGLVLVTFDKAILHLAGEHRHHLLVLTS